MLNLKKGELLVAAIILVWLIALLMLPSNPLDRLPGQDNGVFLYGGAELLSGKSPYVDFWDHKGPLMYVINAIGLLAMDGSRWGVWLVEFIFMTLTAFGLFLIGRRLWGIPISLLSVGIWAFGIFQLGPYHHFLDSNYTESFSLLFGVAALYLWLAAGNSPRERGYYFGIGLLAGLGFMLRPNLIGIQAGIVVVELVLSIQAGMVRRSLVRIGFIALGASCVLAVFALWLFLKGALPEAFDAVVTYNLIYRQKENVYNPFELFVRAAPMVYWLPLIGYILVLFSFLLRKGNPEWETRTASENFMLFLLIGWPIEILFTSASGRFLLHYFITWTPFIGLLIGASTASNFIPFHQWLKRSPSYLSYGAAIFCLFFATLPVLGSIQGLFSHLIYRRAQGIEADSVIIRYVKSQTEPGDKVLVWGNDVWINFLARRPAPSKYIFQYPLFMPGYTSGEKITGFLDDLRGDPPILIIEPVVDTNSISPLHPSRRAIVSDRLVVPAEMDMVFEFVDANYCVVATINDIIVYGYSSGNGLSCP